MALKETYKHLKDLLGNIASDLDKADGGNKAASQRVRTGTVKLEKIAKVYRKESIKSEKQMKGTRKPVRKAAALKIAHKAAAHKTAQKKTAAKKAIVKVKVKAKAHRAVAKARALSFKRSSAKLPTKRAHAR